MGVTVSGQDVVAVKVSSRSPGRLNYLDGMRALAALYVVLHHSWLQVWPAEYGRVPSGVTLIFTHWLAYGHLAVSVFIVISGFSLMLPIVRGEGTLRGGISGFFKRRARRILPPYYAALVLSLVLIALFVSRKTGTHWDVSLPVTVPGLWAHVLLLQDIAFPAQINHAMWSIAAEWRIYFFFPALLLLWQRLGAIPAVLATLVVSCATYWWFKVMGILPPGGASSLVPQYLGLFALGMFAATIAFSRHPRWQALRQRVPWQMLALTALGGLIVLDHAGSRVDILPFDLVTGLGTLGVLVGAAQPGRTGLRTILESRPLVFIGMMSYSLYLIHAPLLQIVWQYAVHPLRLSDTSSFLVLVTLSLPFVLGVTYLFFRICERPFITSTRIS